MIRVNIVSCEKKLTSTRLPGPSPWLGQGKHDKKTRIPKLENTSEIYLDPPRVSNFSPQVGFLVVKGLKFQTLGGFR